MDLTTNLGKFRLLALVEGVSLLLILFVTMPLKYGFQTPQPNKFMGMIHGVLFLVYLVLVVLMTIKYKWKIKKMVLALIASVVPFGTFWADRKLFQS
ncbi:MAG: DUF3817 domain-containing protein [Bacteroidota bacterium]